MEYVNLGRAGVQVSRLCLGTTNFGVRTEEEDAHRIMDAAFERGINFLDTADAYGYAMGKGKTEGIIGRWLAKNREKRDRIVLATKAFTPMTDDINDRGLSAFHIKRACEASLKRLGVDHIDLYQMHHVDRSVPWDEIWQAMSQLIQEGKITYVGTSNFAGWHLAQACETAGRRWLVGPVSEQSLYNLSARTVELEVLPAVAAYGLAFIPYSPVGGGLLAGALTEAETGRRSSPGLKERVAAKRPSLEKYEALCRDLSQAPADVALAWLLHQPGVTAPIIGPRTMEQLDGNLRALELALSEETLSHLDQIWPGPGGPAPEAYAW